MKQIIYILINEAMPGYVKIGFTTDLEQRLKSLDTTGVPLPFECFFAYEVDAENDIEKKLHDAFSDVRVRDNREFFQIVPERVVSALQIANGIDVTPQNDIVETADDQKALDKARSRRPVFNFHMVDISPGSEIVFTRNQEVRAHVYDDRKIEYKGEVLSLNQATIDALQEEGLYWKSVQGPNYWEFEGETLVERRGRLERE